MVVEIITPSVFRRAGMNSTLGVIISTTIRLSSQYLFTIIQCLRGAYWKVDTYTP